MRVLVLLFDSQSLFIVDVKTHLTYWKDGLFIFSVAKSSVSGWKY